MTSELCLSYKNPMRMDNDELNCQTDMASDAGISAMDFVLNKYKKANDDLCNFGDDLLNSDSVVQNVLKEQNVANVEGKDTLLKLALSISTASSVEATKNTTENTTSVPVSEEMITRTEVTDSNSQLRKILYQPDFQPDAKDEKKGEHGENHLDEDDLRLVIAISDDESCETKANRNSTVKLNKPKKHVRFSDWDEKQLARSQNEVLQRHKQGPQTASIEYEINSSHVNGANDKIKFDILTPSISVNENISNMPSSANNKIFKWPNENFEDSIDSQLIYKQCQQQSSDNVEVISISVELNQIGDEIDKRINKKTHKILDIVQELLKSQITKQEFVTRMNETAKTSIGDLIIIAKKLVKRYKFGHNPNSKEFSKLKNLQFPTAPRDMIVYFENLVSTLNAEKFNKMLKLYEIIVKEMLNLNKSKMLQYLIDFMIVRKNHQLDLLNFNFASSMAPTLKSESDGIEIIELKEKAHQNERKIKPNEIAYNFVCRSMPIYQQAGKLQMRLKNVIDCQMTSKMSSKFDKRPFDNNILNGRRIARRLVKHSSRDERVVQLDNNQNNNLITKTIKHAPVVDTNLVTRPAHIISNPMPIVLDNDTPPLSDVSSTHSSRKVRIISNDVVQPAVTSSSDCHAENVQAKVIQIPNNRPAVVVANENGYHQHIKTGHLTLAEYHTLTQNGTEIIPTSIIKNASAAPAQKDPSPINSLQEMRKIYDQPTISTYEEPQGRSVRTQRMPMRRKSCHERIVNNETKNIAEEFDFFKQQQRHLKMMAEEKRMKELRDTRPDPYYSPEIKKARVENKPAYPHQQQQHQQPINVNEQYVSSRQRGNAIDYQFFSDECRRQMLKRGFNHSELQQNQPMEIVSSIHPEHYASRRHQEALMYQHRQHQSQQHRLYQQQDAERRASIAIQQLQDLHRDPSMMDPRKYAEHLKQIEHLKIHQRMREDQQKLMQQQQQQQQQQHNLQNRSKYAIHPNMNSKATNGNHNHEEYARKIANLEFDESQALQKKMKNKSRSVSGYQEPSNQIHVTSKPIVVNQNPPHSTYYSDPQIRNKSSTSSPPKQMSNEFQFTQNIPKQSPSRPIPVPVREHQQQQAAAQSQHHQMQSHHSSQGHPWHISPDVIQRTSQLMQSHLNTNPKNSSHAHNPGHYLNQPTPFLRNYFAVASSVANGVPNNY